ncbi:GNAT family N-acetyltransferase [Pseudokineococcus basanitobsidens]|uniref:GNAT family N-acetyltransferase n=1 Tax=Pseudokineococcus basanitobsidens TaxID=1926649 RepID=A0ABU8RMQ6_9ACTN
MLYAETYLARVAGLGVPVTGVPGMQGVRMARDFASVRLLVVDDRALEGLVGLLRSVRTGRIAVFGQAERCAEAVEDRMGWTSTTTTSMSLGHLAADPVTALPDGLRLRAVDEHAEGRRDAVTMEQAVAVASLADPAGAGDPGVLTRDLTASMPAFRFFAALDADGVARATSGVGVFGSRAVVIFVNTDPGWRRRGLGRAMTAAAVTDARARGASTACLDASASGLSIYQQLGYRVIADTRRYSRSGEGLGDGGPGRAAP